MGMAASQARLLSITARLTNNENTGQAISYSKQRLADQTQQITNEYNEALDATKLTMLTGFNGAEAIYEDISYNILTGRQMAENTKQYIVTDTKGKILVPEGVADAFRKSKGNYNQFLANLDGSCGGPYSQADIDVQVTSSDKDKKANAEQKIHKAWDKYFDTVGINLGDEPHDFGFTWTTTWATNEKNEYLDKDGNVITKDELADKGVSKVGDGYAGYVSTDAQGNYLKADGTVASDMSEAAYLPINYEGTTQESRDLYDYAMALTEAYLRTGYDDAKKVHIKEFDMGTYKSPFDSDNISAINYYRNLFTKMQSSGYFTYTDNLKLASDYKDNYLYTEDTKGTSKIVKSPLVDNYTFEAALRDGTLRLEYYSTTDKKFKSTTISDDTCIVEVADERAIARAESKYTQDMADLENKDNKLDLELKKLDTEHSALQTEYDAVKNVVDKNVESSFKIFS